MGATPLAVGCDRYVECKDRHDKLERRVDGIDDRVRAQGESIAALRVQVAVAAAIGALAGGGIVSIVVKFVGQ